MKKMKRVASLILSIVIILVFSAGCGTSPAGPAPSSAAPSSSAAATSNATTPTPPPVKTVLTYWNGFTGADGDVLKQLVEEYNKSNTMNIEIQMEIMPWDSLWQKLSTTLPVNQGPDIIALATERIGTYAKPGALAVIDDLYSSKGIDSAVIPTALNDNLKFNGKYYAVPQNIATLLMYYNKDMFKDAGLDPEKPPTTWDELIDYAKKLTKIKNGEQQYGFGMGTNNTIPMWPIMIWGAGGDFISNGKSVFNSKENVDTITKWAGLIKNDKIGPPVTTGAEIDKLFESQKLAMYFCGPWATGSFNKAGLNYGISAPPAGPSGKVTLATSVAMVMTKSSTHKDQVYDFFKYWNSIDVQVKWSLGTGFPLARTDAIKDKRLEKNPDIAAFSSVANDALFYLQQLTNYAQIDAEVIIPALESILLTDADVKKTLDDASKQMDMLLAQ